jgi:Xaa-Pro aminopeptidase
LQRWLQGVRALARSGVSAPGAVVDVSVLLDDMRLFKDAEIDLMKRAGVISAEAHCRAMRICRPACANITWKPSCCTNSAATVRSTRPTAPSSPPAPTACVLHYAPATPRSRTATWC